MATLDSLTIEFNLSLETIKKQIAEVEKIVKQSSIELPIKINTQVIESINKQKITPKVELTQLHELNKLLDQKLAHYKKVQKYFKENPLVSNFKINSNSFSATNSKPIDYRPYFSRLFSVVKSIQRESRELNTLIQKQEKTSKNIANSQGNVLRKISGNTKGSFLGSIRTGITESIGADIISPATKTLRSATSKILSTYIHNTFGDIELFTEKAIERLGRTINTVFGITLDSLSPNISQKVVSSFESLQRFIEDQVMETVGVREFVKGKALVTTTKSAKKATKEQSSLDAVAKRKQQLYPQKASLNQSLQSQKETTLKLDQEILFQQYLLDYIQTGNTDRIVNDIEKINNIKTKIDQELETVQKAIAEIKQKAQSGKELSQEELINYADLDETEKALSKKSKLATKQQIRLQAIDQSKLAQSGQALQQRTESLLPAVAKKMVLQGLDSKRLEQLKQLDKEFKAKQGTKQAISVKEYTERITAINKEFESVATNSVQMEKLITDTIANINEVASSYNEDITAVSKANNTLINLEVTQKEIAYELEKLKNKKKVTTDVAELEVITKQESLLLEKLSLVEKQRLTIQQSVQQSQDNLRLSGQIMSIPIKSVQSKIKQIQSIKNKSEQQTQSLEKQIVATGDEIVIIEKILNQASTEYPIIIQNILKDLTGAYVDLENLPQLSVLKGGKSETTEASYIPALNTLNFSDELLKKIQQNAELTAKEYALILHELDHAVQLGFGKTFRSIQQLDTGNIPLSAVPQIDPNTARKIQRKLASPSYTKKDTLLETSAYAKQFEAQKLYAEKMATGEVMGTSSAVFNKAKSIKGFMEMIELLETELTQVSLGEEQSTKIQNTLKSFKTTFEDIYSNFESFINYADKGDYSNFLDVSQNINKQLEVFDKVLLLFKKQKQDILETIVNARKAVQVPLNIPQEPEKELIPIVETNQQPLQSLQIGEQENIRPVSTFVSKPPEFEIGDKITDAFNNLKKSISGKKGDDIKASVKNIGISFSSAYTQFKEAVKSKNLNLANVYATTLKDGANQAFADIDQFIAELKASGQINDEVMNALQSIRGIKGGIARKTKSGGLIDQNLAKLTITDISTEAKQTGQNLTEGIVVGINQGEGKAIASVANLANELIATTKDELGIASPSDEFKKIAEEILNGLIIPLSEEEVGSVGQTIATALESGLNERQIQLRLFPFIDEASNTEIMGRIKAFKEGRKKEITDLLASINEIQLDTKAFIPKISQPKLQRQQLRESLTSAVTGGNSDDINNIVESLLDDYEKAIEIVNKKVPQLQSIGAKVDFVELNKSLDELKVLDQELLNINEQINAIKNGFKGVNPNKQLARLETKIFDEVAIKDEQTKRLNKEKQEQTKLQLILNQQRGRYRSGNDESILEQIKFLEKELALSKAKVQKQEQTINQTDAIINNYKAESNAIVENINKLNELESKYIKVSESQLKLEEQAKIAMTPPVIDFSDQQKSFDFEKFKDGFKNTFQDIHENILAPFKVVFDKFGFDSSKIFDFLKTKGFTFATTLFTAMKLVKLGFFAVEQSFQFLTNTIQQSISDAVQAGFAFEKLSTTLAITTGNSALAVMSIRAISKEAKDLGLSISAVQEQYAKFASATQGTALVKDTDRIFKGFATASSALGLNESDIQGVFLALTQIAAKGKISAEEFRQQLSERLPVAAQVAAEALGKTQAQFTKDLDSGKLKLEDLTLIADKLGEKFADVKSIDTATKAFENFKNEIYQSQLALGQGLLPVIKVLLKTVTGILQVIRNNFDKVLVGGAFLLTVAIKNIISLFPSIGITLSSIGVGLKGIIFKLGGVRGILTSTIGLAKTLAMQFLAVEVAIKAFGAIKEAISGISSVTEEVESKFNTATMEMDKFRAVLVNLQQVRKIDLQLTVNGKEINQELESARQKLKELTPNDKLFGVLPSLPDILNLGSQNTQITSFIPGTSILEPFTNFDFINKPVQEFLYKGTAEQRSSTQFVNESANSVQRLGDALGELERAKITLSKATPIADTLDSQGVVEVIDAQIRSTNEYIGSLEQNKEALLAQSIAYANAGDFENADASREQAEAIKPLIEAQKEKIVNLAREKAEREVAITTMQEHLDLQQRELAVIESQNQLRETQLDIDVLSGIKTQAQADSEKLKLTQSRIEGEIALEKEAQIKIAKTRDEAYATVAELAKKNVNEINDEFILAFLNSPVGDAMAQETKDSFIQAINLSREGNAKLLQLTKESEKIALEIIKQRIDTELDLLNKQFEDESALLENKYSKRRFEIEQSAVIERKLNAQKDVELLVAERANNQAIITDKQQKLKEIKRILKTETMMSQEQKRDLTNQLMTLENEINDVKTNVLNSNSNIVQNLIGQIEDNITTATEANVSFVRDANNQVAQELAQGLISQSDASQRLLQIKADEQDYLIKLDQYRVDELTRLQETIGLTADQEKELTKARQQLANTKDSGFKEMINALQESSSQAISIIESTAKSRSISIQQLINQGLVSQKEADRLKAESTRQSNQERLASEQALLAKLIQFNQQNPTIEGQKAIEAKTKEIGDLTLQVLEDEYQKQQEIVDIINERLQSQSKSIELENQLLQLNQSILDNQTKLTDARGRLTTALNNLESGRTQNKINELNAQLSLIDNEKEQLKIKQEIYDLEKEASQQKLRNLLAEQRQQVIALNIEQKRAELADRQAQNEARTRIIDAQIALNEAKQSGDETAIALAEESLSLAQENLSIVNDSITANQEINRLNRESLLNEQKLERENFASSESINLANLQEEINKLEGGEDYTPDANSYNRNRQRIEDNFLRQTPNLSNINTPQLLNNANLTPLTSAQVEKINQGALSQSNNIENQMGGKLDLILSALNQLGNNLTGNNQNVSNVFNNYFEDADQSALLARVRQQTYGQITNVMKQAMA